MSLPVLVVMGPTSSGKTALGIRLARALGGEVINADARQLYRDAPVGSGIPAGIYKGSVYEIEGTSHHLMSVCGPDEHWSVADWVQAATRCLEDVHRRGKVPLIVGGTGLYIRALTEGFVFSDAGPSAEIREYVTKMPLNDRREELVRLAPDAERLIDLRNPYRVQRALERVLAGQPVQPKAHKPDWRVLKLAIWRAPEEVLERVRRSVHRQLHDGWVEEVERLLQRGVDVYASIFTIIGFRSLVDWIQNGKQRPLEQVEEEIVRDTWQYVRRQMTWLRKEPSLYRVANEDEAISLARAWAAAHGILFL